MELEVRRPDLRGIGAQTYANVVHVTSTPYDFRLTFSLMQTPHDQPASEVFVAEEAPQAVAEILLPAGGIEAVLAAVRHELDIYAERFGTPHPMAHQVGQRR